MDGWRLFGLGLFDHGDFWLVCFEGGEVSGWGFLGGDRGGN